MGIQWAETSKLMMRVALILLDLQSLEHSGIGSDSCKISDDQIMLEEREDCGFGGEKESGGCIAAEGSLKSC